MQFLKTLFWVMIAVALALFTYSNWVGVTINLWGDLRLDTKLPVLVLGAFLLGFLPLYLVHRTHRWRTRRRIAQLEGQLATATAHPVAMAGATALDPDLPAAP